MNTYRLERDIRMEDGYDVVVAGGGPAGTAAAVCAARLGAKVLLAEATGCLGGMGTSGIVAAFDPMADGERSLVGGFMLEVMDTLYERGELPPQVTPEFWREYYHCWTPFNPEYVKIVLDELAVKAGVEVRFYTRVIDADIDGKRVNGVVVAQVDGYRFISAKTFIDATGDAILSDICGIPYREAGRDTEKIMPATMTAICAGVDFDRFGKEPELKDDELDKMHKRPQYLYVEKAIEDGFFTQNDRHIPGIFQIGDTLGFTNAAHIFNVNSVQCESLTEGMMRGRRLAREYAEFFKKYVPGCERLEHVCTASLLGVRESRRIVGEYELTFNDYTARHQFPDQIGVFNKFVDIHVYDTSIEEFERFRKMRNETARLDPGECFGIPYGILVPKGWENLWVAGRCTSSDVMVHGSIRVMPACAMMGQPAGTAAVRPPVSPSASGQRQWKKAESSMS